MSRSDMFLGILLCNDERKDEWFAQIVEKHSEGVLGFKVVSSYFGKGKDNVLDHVCDFAGLKEVPPRARYTHLAHAPAIGVVHRGLSYALRRCEAEIEGLIGDLRRYFAEPENEELQLDLFGALDN